MPQSPHNRIAELHTLRLMPTLRPLSPTAKAITLSAHELITPELAGCLFSLTFFSRAELHGAASCGLAARRCSE